MFSVYGVMGRVFNGPMDQMRQVGGVSALTRSRAVAPIGLDPSSADTGDNLRRSAGAASGTHRPIEAYAQAQAGEAQRHPLTQVRDVMSHKAVVVAQSATVQEGLQLLTDQHVGQAPVINGNGVLVGMLLRADLLRPEHLPGPNTHALAWHAWLAQPVSEVMWTPVPSASPETDLRHVARVLLDTGLPALPVVDANGVVAGLVSRTDLLRAVVHDPPLDLWS